MFGDVGANDYVTRPGFRAPEVSEGFKIMAVVEVDEADSDDEEAWGVVGVAGAVARGIADVDIIDGAQSAVGSANVAAGSLACPVRVESGPAPPAVGWAVK